MNLIQKRQSTRYPELTIYKYKRKVFYNNLWHTDPTLLESRGHVYYDNKLVVNAPTKVFNRNENGTDIDPDEECLVVEKINGFMACVTWVPEVNDVVVSTTGSLDSDYVDMARSMMPQVLSFVKYLKTPYTYFFEVCHPNDPNIIPENIGCYLLGMRHIEDTTPYFSTQQDQKNLDDLAIDMHVMRPKWGIHTFKKSINIVKHLQIEGYMYYGQSSKTVLKFKTPYYLALKTMARKDDILSLSKSRVSEEFYPLLKHLKQNASSFSILSEQEKLKYITTYLETSYV